MIEVKITMDYLLQKNYAPVNFLSVHSGVLSNIFFFFFFFFLLNKSFLFLFIFYFFIIFFIVVDFVILGMKQPWVYMCSPSWSPLPPPSPVSFKTAEIPSAVLKLQNP